MIARGGLPFVIAPAVLVAFLLLAAIAFSSNAAVTLTIPAGVVFAAFLVFFRDPPRHAGRGVVSPADGRVIEADREAGHLTVYMGFLDVHVNRAPWSGVVVGQTRKAGGHSLASSSAAKRNAKLEWRLGTLVGTILLTQSTGMFARRIVPYVGEGASVKKGQRIGLIRFGSRVELTLPPTARIVAAVGDRVRAGETTIAEVGHAS